MVCQTSTKMEVLNVTMIIAITKVVALTLRKSERRLQGGLPEQALANIASLAGQLSSLTGQSKQSYFQCSILLSAASAQFTGIAHWTIHPSRRGYNQLHLLPSKQSLP